MHLHRVLTAALTCFRRRRIGRNLAPPALTWYIAASACWTTSWFIGTIIRIDADPDARDRRPSTVDFTRRQKGIDDLPFHLGEVITLHDVWHQHHEFIAPSRATVSIARAGNSSCVVQPP